MAETAWSLVAGATLIAWQVALVYVVIRRLVWFGVGALVFTGLWCAVLLWAGSSIWTCLALLTLTESLLVFALAYGAPLRSRFVYGGFSAAGLLSVVGTWIVAGLAGSRVVVVGTLLVAVTVYALERLATRRGQFSLGFLAGQRVGPPRPRPARDAMYKYSYWSRRAIEELISTNHSGNRFSLRLAEVSLPSFAGFGPAVTFERAVAKEGRHHVALSVEAWLKDYISTDPTHLIREGRGFLAGQGDVHVTAYGSQGEDALAVTGGRAALFAHWRTSDDRWIALCLFGSMDNFDGWIRDSHPQAMTGWASSATPDVMRWLQQGREWNLKTWPESIGNVACKMANYEIAIGESDGDGTRRGYEKDFILRGTGAEWLAFIYHVETKEKRYCQYPFDVVLVGRPIWVRTKHLAIQTGDEYSTESINQNARQESAYRQYWFDMLKLDHRSDGWPSRLYQLIVPRRNNRPGDQRVQGGD